MYLVFYHHTFILNLANITIINLCKIFACNLNKAPSSWNGRMGKRFFPAPNCNNVSFRRWSGATLLPVFLLKWTAVRHSDASSRKWVVLLSLTGDWQLSAHGVVFSDYRRRLRVCCAARVFFFMQTPFSQFFQNPKVPFWKGRGKCWSLTVYRNLFTRTHY